MLFPQADASPGQFLSRGRILIGAQTERSIHALPQHGVGHLQEADDIGAGLDVTLLAVLSCGVGALAVDVLHDLLQLGVHRLKGPVQALAVLAHLQAGDSHAAGVGSLGGGVEEAGGFDGLDGLGSTGHVGALKDGLTAVGHQQFGGVGVDLVLGGAKRVIVYSMPLLGMV
mgnify:CR=1 FL=1